MPLLAHRFVRHHPIQILRDPRCNHVIHVSYQRKSIIVHTSIVEYSEIVGRGLMLFVLFASSLNWVYYKHMREEIEKHNNNKKDEK